MLINDNDNLFIAGAKDDAIISQLAEKRDGAMAGHLRDRVRTRRFALNYAELVSFLFGIRDNLCLKVSSIKNKLIFFICF